MFFDMTADGKPLGRIVMELRSDVVPKTAENFRALCTGEKGFGYEGSTFDRVIPNLLCQTGDLTNHDHTCERSIYGPIFRDEKFLLKYNRPGTLYMANARSNINGSQFLISLDNASWMDGINVVFGSVVEGMDVVKKIESYGSKSGKTRKKIVIAKAAQL